MVEEVKRGKGKKERVNNEDRECERLEKCEEGKEGRRVRQRGDDGQRERTFWGKED